MAPDPILRSLSQNNLPIRHSNASRPRTLNVYPVDECQDSRKVLLSGTDALEHPAVKAFLSSHSSDHVSISSHEVPTSYEHYSVEKILRMLLPSEIQEIPCAFEVAGHLAHVNLREECLPFRKIIGQVILDKNQPRLQTVVNKIGNIENEFRTFPMEVIAGESNMEVEVKETGCRFRLNFSQVYWNSRLQYEHRRLVEKIAGVNKSNGKSKNKQKKKWRQQRKNLSESNIIVADIMCGVGPFAIPLASLHGVQVHANDLNPQSFKYLLTNEKLNKCNADDLLKTYNMDGRDFIRLLEKDNVIYHHAIMNLPAIAIEFLDVFRGWKPPSTDPTHMPTIHVHCFVKYVTLEDMEETALKRCEKALGCSLNRVRDNVEIHVVRDVSPKKNMLCISFRLPEEVKDLARISLSGIQEKDTDESGCNVQNPKKPRLD
eukprot:CAMPEP_0116004260 /NCGR_PEP_ID=MMETSP0321-20121206/503_1 /TAXON_ID=163516 /ORGANISM="Leptocylindrus danicus var. danicus, Strain B650" /LENGTH=430 /DNA_ID=CAMNT_0003472541 /DNA_START=91 /DNA_END=1384 /DNA_ORIENTATION=+